MQSSANVVVVQAQPTVSTQVIRSSRTGDYFLTLSMVMTVLCCIFGGWWSLMFTIPAVVLAGSVSIRLVHLVRFRFDAIEGSQRDVTVAILTDASYMLLKW